jgi:hypothetical protein
MKVLFHSNQLGMRGTEVALYDYALYNEIILGNKSIIVSDSTKELSTLDKFKSKFEVLLYDEFKDVQSFVDKNKIDFTYFIKSGNNDGKLLANTKNSIHAVFQEKQIHGDNYAYVSEWLANKMNMPGQYVPHIVTLPEPTDTFRKKLNIPKDAIVVGRYGGFNEFDIPFVHRAISNVISTRNDIYFLMMNTAPFLNHERLIYVDSTYKLQNKSNFINTCDYMIHARGHGESFGLSICEFLFLNKPVITFKGGLDQNHLMVLKEKGLYYTDYNSLVDILLSLGKPQFDVTSLVTQFSPSNVMERFANIFLK